MEIFHALEENVMLRMMDWSLNGNEEKDFANDEWLSNRNEKKSTACWRDHEEIGKYENTYWFFYPMINASDLFWLLK
jgi:hypothetical protein